MAIKSGKSKMRRNKLMKVTKKNIVVSLVVAPFAATQIAVHFKVVCIFYHEATAESMDQNILLYNINHLTENNYTVQ